MLDPEKYLILIEADTCGMKFRFLEVNQKNQIFSKCGTSWLALKIASKIWKISEKDFKTV